jgi:hypothetical protein
MIKKRYGPLQGENRGITGMGKRQVAKPLCLCKAATSALTKRPFIFIIDEINRANLPVVFGDLLYCLEYRGKQVPRRPSKRCRALRYLKTYI